MSQVELSIIVPILNECVELPQLLDNLQRQQQLDFELIFVDGGSSDGSREWLQQETAWRLVTSTRGRARQLNAGAAAATGSWLLFLHVDSRFADPLAVRHGLDLLQETGSCKLAGHFALDFRRSDDRPSAGYYYYAWKARLGRSETIHGDQGFLLQRQLFDRLGGFREEMRVMEDTDFAERLREVGHWCLLPAEISTSARRFEVEGLWQRQLLGALLMCFRSIGWDAFFAAAPDVYRQQAETERLKVRPFFALVRRLLRQSGLADAWRIWYRSGCYVRRHAWQLAFALDARRNFRQGIPIGQGRLTIAEIFEPVYELLTDNLLGRLAATLLLRSWFELTDLWLRWREKG